MTNEEVKEQMHKTRDAYEATADALSSSVERALFADENLEERKEKLAEKYMQEVKPTPSNPLGSKVIRIEEEGFADDSFLIVNKHGYIYLTIDGRGGVEPSPKIKEQAAQLKGEQKGNINTLTYKLASYYIADAFQKTYGVGENAHTKSGLDKMEHKYRADKTEALKDSGLVETPKGLKYDYMKTIDYRLLQLKLNRQNGG